MDTRTTQKNLVSASMFRRVKRNIAWPQSEAHKIHTSHMKTYGTPETPDKNCFHQAIRPLLVTAICFTVMPVEGITMPRSTNLRFRWCSFRVAYCLMGLVCVGTMMVFWTVLLFKSGLLLNNFSAVVFYGTTFVTMVLFLGLARQWPLLVAEVDTLEQALRAQYGYSKTFARDTRLLAAFFLVLALVEHLLSISKNIIMAVECTSGHITWVRIYFLNFYNQVFKYVPYSTLIGCLLFFTDNVATFAWNFGDLFVMVISMMLRQRFQQYNRRIKPLMNEVLTQQTWRRLREDFATLSSLVATVDSRISKIVLISFWNNLYFVCLQLYYSIVSKRSLEDAIYFYASFGFLLSRFLAVCLFAAGVNDESKDPLPVLYSAPRESYCTELQRFLDQVTGEEVALTALNFFSLTRKLLLTVAGTIVTYEMIMVQLNTGNSQVTNVTVPENVSRNPFCPELM